MTDCILEFCRLDPQWQESLAEFFSRLALDPTARFFHPHPFDSTHAARYANFPGHDLYYVAVCSNNVLAYGMLRGWNDGFDVPSLGIALDRVVRNKGLGKTFMHFLHAAARMRGAAKIRLKVHPDNQPALGLYRQLGYHFEDHLSDELVGVLDLE